MGETGSSDRLETAYRRLEDAISRIEGFAARRREAAAVSGQEADGEAAAATAHALDAMRRDYDELRDVVGTVSGRLDRAISRIEGLVGGGRR